MINLADGIIIWGHKIAVCLIGPNLNTIHNTSTLQLSIHVHTYTVYVCTHTRTHTHTHAHTHTHTHIGTHMQAHTHIGIYACTHTHDLCFTKEFKKDNRGKYAHEQVGGGPSSPVPHFRTFFSSCTYYLSLIFLGLVSLPPALQHFSMHYSLPLSLYSLWN